MTDPTLSPLPPVRTADPRRPVRCSGGGRWIQVDGRPQAVTPAYPVEAHWPPAERGPCGWTGNSHGPAGTLGWVALRACPVCGGGLEDVHRLGPADPERLLASWGEEEQFRTDLPEETGE